MGNIKESSTLYRQRYLFQSYARGYPLYSNATRPCVTREGYDIIESHNPPGNRILNQEVKKGEFHIEDIDRGINALRDANKFEAEFLFDAKEYTTKLTSLNYLNNLKDALLKFRTNLNKVDDPFRAKQISNKISDIMNNPKPDIAKIMLWARKDLVKCRLTSFDNIHFVCYDFSEEPQGILSGIYGAINKMRDALNKAGGKIGDGVSEILERIQYMADTVYYAMSNQMSLLGENWQSLMDKLQEFCSWLKEKNIGKGHCYQ